MVMAARRLARTLVAAHLCTSARAWDTVVGLKTKKLTVSEAPAGAPTIAKGDTITVHATGVVKETDKKFWSTKDPGQQPFTYNAGVGSVTTCVESDFGRPTPSTRRASVAASARWRGDSTPSTRRRPRGRVGSMAWRLTKSTQYI